MKVSKTENRFAKKPVLKSLVVSRRQENRPIDYTIFPSPRRCGEKGCVAEGKGIQSLRVCVSLSLWRTRLRYGARYTVRPTHITPSIEINKFLFIGPTC